MTFQPAAEHDDASRFLNRYGFASRVWPTGSAEGFVNWLFVYRRALDSGLLRSHAIDYIREVLEHRAHGTDLDTFVARTAKSQARKMAAVNSARRRLQKLVKKAKATSHGEAAWSTVCELATSDLAASYIEITGTDCLMLVGEILRAIAKLSPRLVECVGNYAPTSNGENDEDRMVRIDLYRLDESLGEEPDWDGCEPYYRRDIDALLRLTFD